MKKHEDLFACRSAIRRWIEEHRQELVQTLVELVRIPSVRVEAAPAAPFGKACATMLDAVEALYQKYGIPTISDREGGYILGYCGDGERCIGLFAHGDVVAPGEDWLYTAPFSPIEKDGFLVGRGALDDKSAIVISLACARMLGELALPFPAKLLCYTGFNEESGMQDIRNYRAAHIPPDFALVCDTGYPLYRGNKGILNLEAEADTHLTDILDFYGGESSNVTLGKATVALRYSDSLHNWLEREKSDAVSLTKQETMLLLHATGISCHGALPQGSVNAGGILADLLSCCPHIADGDRTAMSFLSSILNYYDGSALGIRTDDAEFGPLTCINGTIRMNEGKPVITLNIRFGISSTPEALKKALSKAFSANGWTVRFRGGEAAHLLSADDPYVRACMEVYRTYTGDHSATSRLNAGGTYAIHLPRAAEIGPMLWRPAPFPLPAGHGQVHQPDECISIDGMLDAIELTMLMLLACGETNR